MGRNWQWSYAQGRIKRLNAEVTARQSSEPFDVNQIPLHSYDGTMQSKFKRGWLSICETDIQCRLNGHNTYQQVRQRLAKQFGARHE
ncbi:hypothetical protein [Pseudoalteromonas piscicida]|uniref:Uncharacterized protein n=1 Tax=Pseudoalteromonas piscicida TaxID=43662 RepID=A0AAD0RFD7_PSEO7|nr:hypothetical protein [Pseudoalteromonas piscicida]ASD67704.1 hypothetical protein B1L02_12195 [Pseudoalteromonas piscicida]AXR01592.1 hypothetical protein D0511_05535 [Pseudoalteromonas piscicida]